MMRSVKVFLGIFIASCFFTATVYSADVAKIGVVDFERIFKESNTGKKIKAEIEKNREGMSEELKKKQMEIQKLQEDYQREKMVLSQDRLAEKEREMNIKVYDLNMLKKRYENEMKKFAFEKTEKLKDHLFTIADDYGQKEGYMLIVEKNSIVYYQKKMDITDSIIKLLNTDTTAQ